MACLGREVYDVLFSAYGGTISDQNEKTLKENIMRLVVRKKNRMLAVMEMLALKQESDESIVNFLSRVKAKARQCELNIACSCGQRCDYTDNIALYMLIAGLSDPEIQEELLVIEDITLEKAEQKAVTKEAAKCSQSEMTGEKLSKIRSSYSRNKGSGSATDNSDLAPLKCGFCGGSRHESREKECKAYDALCKKCGKTGHFKKVCRSKKVAQPESEQDEKVETSDFLAGGVFSLSTISTGDLIFDKKSQRWVQRSLKNKKVETLPLSLEICKDSMNKFRAAKLIGNKIRACTAEGIADTGCSIMCTGIETCHKLGVPLSKLVKSDVTLKVADGHK